ncbi:MAG TPA: hypothetical protein VEF72_30540, partial [Mycobacterium sp.]|nr:hypothetical protein [Mycobacterium sp.]
MDTSDRGDDKAPRAHAAERAAELKRRKIELQTHQPVNPENVELVARRARGRIALTDLRLGSVTAYLQAEGQTVKTR